MKVLLEGQLISVYLGTDYKDKETGEISQGKHKLQLLVENELQNGSIRNEMQDISIPNSKVKEYEAQIGKKIQLKCDCSSKTPIFLKVK